MLNYQRVVGMVNLDDGLGLRISQDGIKPGQQIRYKVVPPPVINGL